MRLLSKKMVVEMIGTLWTLAIARSARKSVLGPITWMKLRRMGGMLGILRGLEPWIEPWVGPWVDPWADPWLDRSGQGVERGRERIHALRENSVVVLRIACTIVASWLDQVMRFCLV